MSRGAPMSRYLERVQRVLAAYGAPNTGADAVAEWVATVAAWNKRIDLTAARDDNELVDLMVADAAMLAGLIARAGDARPVQRVVDVGTGAGAPGLPLALFRDDLELTLVEPLQKRATLLRLCKGRYPSARLIVQQAKGADLDGHYDVALSRATLPPPAWLELGAKLAPQVWVLLAKQAPPQLDGWRVTHDEGYVWPLTHASRRLVSYAVIDDSPSATGTA